MSSLFKVKAKNKYTNKEMTVSVYGVRTNEKPKDYKDIAEFLVYYQGNWIWMSCTNYEPINNKHS